jgi:adenosylhomocysteine nucleosidase
MAIPEHVGVMGAMPEEVARIHEHLDTASVTEHVGRRFHHGWLAGRRVTLVGSRIGKVAAAVTATTLIRDVGVDAIVFTGVAGSLVDGVRIGDVVIADELVQHDLAGPPDMFERGEIPLLGVRALPTDSAMRAAAVAAAQGFVDGGPAAIVGESRLRELGAAEATVHVGSVATGDEFVHGPLKAVVAERVPESLCVDMEGAAVAQVCFEHGGVPLCVIRTISDLAGGTASADFARFLAELAPHYSYEIVRRMFER